MKMPTRYKVNLRNLRNIYIDFILKGTREDEQNQGIRRGHVYLQ